MSKLIKKYLSKPNFWFFQISGWIIFSVFDYFESMEYYFERYPGINGRIGWVFLIIGGFLITLIFRYIYRKQFVKKLSIFKKLLFLTLCSLLGSFIWTVYRNWIDIGILLHNYENFDFLFKGLNTFNNAMLRLGYNTSHLFGWSILYFGIKNWYSYIDGKIKYERTKTQAKNAQLQMLRYQIHPHFLFNSLNSIKALTLENPEQAGLMITELSEFLRTTFSYDDKIFIAIKDEIYIIEKYLNIEKIRFEERINFSIICNKEIENNKLLCFLTQPLVENAIKHGLNNNLDGINIRIIYSRIDGYLSIEILNEGFLRMNNTKGTGIKNVQDRLYNAYFGDYSFSIKQQDKQVKVQILIPDKYV